MSKENILGIMNDLDTLLAISRNNGELLNGIMHVAGKSTGADAVLMNSNGKIVAGADNVPSNLKFQQNDFWYADKSLCDSVVKFKEPKSNINLGGKEKCCAAVIPVQGGSSFVFLKNNKEDKFSDDEMANAKLCANNVSLIMKQEQYENEKQSKRELKIARDVLNSLSFTEIDVISEVFDYIKDGEGFVVASKIADRNGYARSVTVNALRKLESAGVIQTRSLGVKGTYIKVTNNALCSEVSKLKKRK